jgi:hypothetical protein
MNFQVGDFVVRKPEHRGEDWGDECSYYLRVVPDSPVEVVWVSYGGSTIRLENHSLLWTARYFDLFAPGHIEDIEQYL